MMVTENSAEQDEAAGAFEALRAEVAELRTVIEPLPQEWKTHAPPDYSVSLGQITQRLTQMTALLARIEKHPALAMTPAIHHQIIAESGEVVMRQAVSRFDEATQRMEWTRQELGTILGDARRRAEQWKWLAITACAAMVVGLFSAPFVVRGLPSVLESRVAAVVMGMDRWEAGSALMRLESPEGWREIAWSAELVSSNRVELNACREVARKTLKPKRCEVIVFLP